MRKGQAVHMKNRLFLILSVGIMLFAGCGNKGSLTMPKT
jgi:predicted small lipoprotein YifL